MFGRDGCVALISTHNKVPVALPLKPTAIVLTPPLFSTVSMHRLAISGQVRIGSGEVFLQMVALCLCYLSNNLVLPKWRS